MLIGLLAASAESATSRPAAHGSAAGTVNIGVVMPFSGAAAAIGTLVSYGCQAAANAVDQAGGINGAQLKCVNVDDTGDPADAVPDVTRAIATDNLSGAIGLETQTAAATTPLLTNAKIPFFTSNGLPAFDKTTDPYFWRLWTSDSQGAASWAVWAKKKRFASAAVVIQTGAGNDDAVPALKTALKNLKIRQAGSLLIPGDSASYASIVSRVVKAHPAVLILSADSQTTATFLTQYKQLNNGSVPPLITAADSLTPDYFHSVQKVLGPTYVTKDMYFVGYHQAPPGQAYHFYVNELKHIHGISKADISIDSSQGTGLHYDGVTVEALAMVAAHSTTGAVWNRAIPSVIDAGAGKVVVHTFAQGAAALKAHKKIDYVGVGGQILLNRYHNTLGSFTVLGFQRTGSSRTLGEVTGAQITAALR